MNLGKMLKMKSRSLNSVFTEPKLLCREPSPATVAIAENKPKTRCRTSHSRMKIAEWLLS